MAAQAIATRGCVDDDLAASMNGEQRERIFAADALPTDRRTAGRAAEGVRASADADASWRIRFAPVLLAIGLPFLLLLLNDSWILTYPDTVDGWVYFGYFENTRTLLHSFAGTYYGTRLSWILPGAVLHQVLPDPVANLVLHLLVHCAGGIAVSWTLGRVLGRRTAMLAVVLLGTYAYYLYSVGWNYVDGAGIAYYSSAMAALTAVPDARWRRTALVVGGAAFMAAVHTNILWLAMAPPFAFYAFHVCRRPAAVMIGDALALAAGGVGCTAVLGAINVALGSTFLFFMPSFNFASASLMQPSPFHSPGWLLDGRWLIVPFVALLCALVWRWRHGADVAARPFVDHFLLAWLMLVVLELAGRPVLERPFSASYLIPGTALAVGAMLSGPLSRLTDGEFRRLLVMAAITGVGVYFAPVAQVVFRVLWPVPLAVVGLLLIAAYMVKPGRPRALAALVVAAAVSNIGVADGHVFDFTGQPTRANSFRAILQASDVVDEIDPSAAARFWYSERSAMAPIYLAVSSTRLWGYRLVGTRFPSLWNPIVLKDTDVKAGERIIILSDDSGALTAAAATLQPLKLRPSPLTERQVESGNIRFHVALAELVPVAP